MKNKLLKTLLPISAIASAIAPTMCLASCGKKYEVQISCSVKDLETKYKYQTELKNVKGDKLFNVEITYTGSDDSEIEFDELMSFYAIESDGKYIALYEGTHYGISIRSGKTISLGFFLSNIEKDNIDPIGFQIPITYKV